MVVRYNIEFEGAEDVIESVDAFSPDEAGERFAELLEDAGEGEFAVSVSAFEE